MYFILDALAKGVCFEIGLYFGTFVVPVLLHSCFGVAYLN